MPFFIVKTLFFLLYCFKEFLSLSLMKKKHNNFHDKKTFILYKVLNWRKKTERKKSNKIKKQKNLTRKSKDRKKKRGWRWRRTRIEEEKNKKTWYFDACFDVKQVRKGKQTKKKMIVFFLQTHLSLFYWGERWK